MRVRIPRRGREQILYITAALVACTASAVISIFCVLYGANSQTAADIRKQKVDCERSGMDSIIVADPKQFLDKNVRPYVLCIEKES